MAEERTTVTAAGATPAAALQLPLAAEYHGKLSELSRDYVAALREDGERAVWAGESGNATALRITAGVDALVRFIVEVESLRFAQRYARGTQHRCAVIAQGGYGRSDMSPYSDVDLLVVYPGRMSPYVETVTERLIQTLFDGQLQVGWAVRTLRDCLDQAAQDLTVKTTMFDSRLVSGSEDLGAQFTKDVQEVLVTRDAQGFIAAKRGEFDERHARLGGSVFLLEPNVKEGEGGLRDLHTLLWIGRVRSGIRGLEDLVPSGLATDTEARELIGARDFLLRVRHALHALTRYKQDKLGFENQEKIAERFGYRGDDRHGAVDLFMRDYYRNAAIIGRTAGDLIDRLTAPPEPKGIISRLGSRKVREGVSIASGQLVVDETSFERDPLELVRVFADSQRSGVTLSSKTRAAVRKRLELLTDELAQGETAVDIFMGVLKANDGVYHTLAEMNRLGVLGRLIPEFGRLFCMVQHDAYHIYTVDEHSLIGIRELERLREGAFAEASPLLTQVMRECDRPELLYLAMMFHDLGKGYGGDHDERGALMVVEIANRLRLTVDDRATLEFLVRHHLTMSMLAQNRDIEDPHLVVEFVRTVGTLETLRYLYLLTFADMRAVGPQIWTGWKDHLLGELYQRAIEAFETGLVEERDLSARARRVRQLVIEEGSGEDERRRLETFTDAMPDSYLLSNTIDRIIDHWRLYESLGGALFRSGVAHYRERGFSEFTICTADRPGLFVRLAGVLSANGLDILGAKIVTSATDVAIDTFRVDHGAEPERAIDPELWAAVRADVEKTLTGELDVAARVAETRRRRAAMIGSRKARKRAFTRVSIDNGISPDFTVIDVHAADRPGLLFTVADAIFRLGLTIHLAKITTRVHQVLDVFYVTDANGAKIEDPERHREISDFIFERIRETENPQPATSTPAAAAS